MSNIASIRPTGIRNPLTAPQTWEDVERRADLAVKSGLYRAADGGDAKAQAIMVIMKALEMGLPVTHALQSMFLRDGNIVTKADALRPLIWAAGFKLSETITGDGDNRTATCTITRPTGETITRSFSVAEAKRAGLYSADANSYWQRYGDRTLAPRALGYASRDGASDVTGGMYLAEELDGPRNTGANGGASNQAGATHPVDTIPHAEPKTTAPAIVTDFAIPDDADAPEPEATSPTPATKAPTIYAVDELMRLIEQDRRSGDASGIVELRYAPSIGALTPSDRDAVMDAIYADDAAIG